MAMRDTLLSEVEAFLSAEKVEPTKLGREALGDPNFVRDLRNGRRTWPETAQKVRRYMTANRGAASRAAAQSGTQTPPARSVKENGDSADRPHPDKAAKSPAKAGAR